MSPMENIENIKASRNEWEKNTLAEFLKQAELKEQFKTPSGIPLKPIYGPEDVENINFLDDIGFPGSSPFTRGVYPTMYRGRLWTMRQYAGFGDAVQTNKRFKYLISRGQRGLSVAFDLPTQMGYNSDNQLCHGEVGKVGVSINSLKDFEKLFEGILVENPSLVYLGDFDDDLMVRDGFKSLNDGLENWFLPRYGERPEFDYFVVLRWEVTQISQQLRKEEVS